MSKQSRATTWIYPAALKHMKRLCKRLTEVRGHRVIQIDWLSTLILSQAIPNLKKDTNGKPCHNDDTVAAD